MAYRPCVALPLHRVDHHSSSLAESRRRPNVKGAAKRAWDSRRRMHERTWNVLVYRTSSRVERYHVGKVEMRGISPSKTQFMHYSIVSCLRSNKYWIVYSRPHGTGHPCFLHAESIRKNKVLCTRTIVSSGQNCTKYTITIAPLSNRSGDRIQ